MVVDKVLKRGIRYKIALANDHNFKLSDFYILRLAPFVIALPIILMFAILFNKDDKKWKH